MENPNAPDGCNAVECSRKQCCGKVASCADYTCKALEVKIFNGPCASKVSPHEKCCARRDVVNTRVYRVMWQSRMFQKIFNGLRRLREKKIERERKGALNGDMNCSAIYK